MQKMGIVAFEPKSNRIQIIPIVSSILATINEHNNHLSYKSAFLNSNNLRLLGSLDQDQVTLRCSLLRSFFK